MARQVIRYAVMSVALMAAWMPGAGDAIVIRHDRIDSDYVALAAGFQAVCSIGDGHGTLIDRQWILTAAHIAQHLEPGVDLARFRDDEHVVDRVILHPTWQPNGANGSDMTEWVDMALVRLASPVKRIEPVSLYEDRGERGMTATFVGGGMTGDGRRGAVQEDGTLRASTNRVERTDRDWLYFVFDAPPTATDMEGISGPGDSGGPALVEVDGMRLIIGVSSRNEYNKLRRGECTYGTTEVYARVSSHYRWVQRTIDAGQAKGRRPSRR